MDHTLVSTILALLLSLSQAYPLMDPGSGDSDSPLNSIQADDPADVDITLRILQRNHANYQKQRIENAMVSFNRETCIRFVPWFKQRDFISIQNADGCFSYLGRTGGKQVLGRARNGCVYHGIIQHELNHALGFYHEHTKSDRDQYIRINWENVAPRTIYDFQTQDTKNLYTPYDYTSIMHYGRTAFSTNGRETITPIPNPNQPIGQRTRMPAGNILRIKRLYRVQIMHILL